MNRATNSAGEKIRFSIAERMQYEFRSICLDELIDLDHPARLLWEYLGQLDLSGFHANFKAVSGKAGRPPVDPRILLTLWLYATIEGVSSGRRLARLCQRDAVFMWICGNVSVNYNMLNDFRVSHTQQLAKLMSETIAVLQYHQLIDFKRVSQDGIRVRANAGKSSFRKQESLETLLEEARQQVDQVLTTDPDELSSEQQAARELAANDRKRRLEIALSQHTELSQKREKRKKGDGEKTRVSTTDPEARNMKMSDGGFRPAFNAQVATLNDSRIIVGVEVTNEGTDSGQMKPMLDQIESDFGERPTEILADGGFNSREDVTAVERNGTELYSPVREARKDGRDPYAPRSGDSEEVARWRARMKTPTAQEVYKQRSSTAEFPFARFRNHGLHQMPVRGLRKSTAIIYWHALVHNFQQILTKNWLPYFTQS